MTILLNDQTGGFVTHAVYSMPTTFAIVSGDLNADTYIDLIANDPTGITVFINDTVSPSGADRRFSTHRPLNRVSVCFQSCAGVTGDEAEKLHRHSDGHRCH